MLAYYKVKEICVLIDITCVKLTMGSWRSNVYCVFMHLYYLLSLHLKSELDSIPFYCLHCLLWIFCLDAFQTSSVFPPDAIFIS